MPTYKYQVDGTAAGNTLWTTTGEVVTNQPGQFPTVAQTALRESFQQLTEGRAVFGDPSTCHGPYTIRRLTVELIEGA